MVLLGLQPGWPGMATLTLAAAAPGLITWTLSPWKRSEERRVEQEKWRRVWAGLGGGASTSLKDWKYCSRWEARTGWSEVTLTGPPNPLAQVKIASPPPGMVLLGLQPG